MDNDKEILNIDIFISYANEDAETIARPLAAQLICRGCRVWFAEYSIGLGDSLRQKITDGLSACRFGVIILSPDFFRKNWTRYELDGLSTREISEGKKIILPIWHNVSFAEVAKYSPVLADRKAVSTSEGLSQVAKNIIKELSSYHLHPPDGVPVPLLLNTYISLWKQESKLLNIETLNLFYLNQSEMDMTTDAYGLIIESACEENDAYRWIEAIPLEIYWDNIKSLISHGKSRSARISAVKLLKHDIFRTKDDYDVIVGNFFMNEKDKHTISIALSSIDKRKSVGNQIANRILEDSRRLIPPKDLLNFLGVVCDRELLIKTIHHLLDHGIPIDENSIAAINMLGEIESYESIPLLKRLLSGDCGPNEGLCIWYFECIGNNLLKLGLTEEETTKIAGSNAYLLNAYK